MCKEKWMKQYPQIMLCIEAASCTSHWKFKSSHVFHYKRLVVLKYQCSKGCLLDSKCCQLHCHCQTFINSEFEKRLTLMLDFVSHIWISHCTGLLARLRMSSAGCLNAVCENSLLRHRQWSPTPILPCRRGKANCPPFAQCVSQSLWEALSREE